jgi:hypothetical protein
MGKRTKYVPPSPEVLHQYARNVCEQLALSSKLSFDVTAVSDDFAQFLTLAASVYAERLTKNAEHDESLDSNPPQD